MQDDLEDSPIFVQNVLEGEDLKTLVLPDFGMDKAIVMAPRLVR